MNREELDIDEIIDANMTVTDHLLRDAIRGVVIDAMNRAAEREREACAKLCEEMARRHDDIRRAALEVVAEWIRARGESK